ncbi:MAG: tRNA uridine-5-carboxymethylaminomethyl(34) synthesis GTPase MnmE [Alphaproteobacteria bacterium]|nr:tRNA uridine-5-carboxymethylaminomethyl(34) synthesis GTPase MnmE [Alphaproteobacteria bacterium]MCL2505589.1 tRNA uridine-5-carboxymethylaminomethyl(34) synthesis GTPase MnmE [Alphaproteobacteria bacterium]
MKSTIFALATAAGRGSVSVYRISGGNALVAAEKCFLEQEIPEPRKAYIRSFVDNESGKTIDKCIVLYFKAPASFTGEDVIELHTHGGIAVRNAIMGVLSKLPGFRLAEPGEFTRRAFENGKLDLTEAEAIADLVDAETEYQREQALRQLGGALSELYDGWRNALIRILAFIEAEIDFAEEELPETLIEETLERVKKVKEEIEEHLNDSHRGERLREGFSVVIIGKPNAGKSSLLNVLAKRDIAIVSPIAGTTRDTIEVHLDIKGYPVVLIDTAGLRERPQDEIEKEGIKRALKRAKEADLRILVLDGMALDRNDIGMEDTITVISKKDLINGGETSDAIRVSSVTGEGIEQLVNKIHEHLEDKYNVGGVSLTRTRHRNALTECVQHMDNALSIKQTDMRAEEIRAAMRRLGSITGHVDVEDLLDVIFKDFCIGK